MIAEPAAAPGANGASQSNANVAATQDPPQGPEATPAANDAAADRAAELEMLSMLEVPTEILDRVRQSAEKDDKGSAPGGQQQQPTPPATQAAAPAAAGEHEELTPEQRANTDPKLIARIDKLTGRIKGDLEPKLAEKDAEIARLKALVPAPGQAAAPQQQPASGGQDPPAGDANPYRGLKSETEVMEQARVAREMRNWAFINREGAFGVAMPPEQPGGEPRVKDFTAAEMSKIWLDASNALEVSLPARLVQLRQEQTQAQVQRQIDEIKPRWETFVTQEFPDLADPESQLSANVDALLETLPSLKAAPNGRWIAATLAKAHLDSNEKLIAAGLAPRPAINGSVNQPAAVDPKLSPFLAPKPPRAPAVPSTAHAAPPPPATDAEEKQAREEYLNSSQSEEDFTVFVERLSESQAHNGKGNLAPARV